MSNPPSLRSRFLQLGKVFFVAVLFLASYSSASAAEINPEQFGAIGNGIANDTVAMQAMLTQCSNNGDTCKITNGKSYLIGSPLYMWGNANLQGDGGELKLNVTSAYMIRIGISGVNVTQNAFTGNINNVNFRVVGGTSGRILFFFRTDGAHITNNHFDVGTYSYSSTSSGNDNAVLSGATNYIRLNITIEGNTVTANATNLGNEGIGIADFDGVIIRNNYVYGVGDDPIGVHYSQNIEVSNNRVQSVDGRIFISNPVNAVIKNNIAKRIPSPQNGTNYAGIALIYIGFENTAATSSFSAPTNVNVFNNTLLYSPNSIDLGAAIYIYAPRNVVVKNNYIISDSSTNAMAAIYILPTDFTGGANWTDPAGLDVGGVNGYARVYAVSVVKNIMTGMYPRAIQQSGNTIKYDTAGSVVTVDSNQALSYSFYTPNVQQTNNVSVSTASIFATFDSSLNQLTDYQSPYIDTGTDNGLTSDYAGNPIYGAPDIGAYEYQPPYTFAANNIPTTGSTRLYSDGHYRMTTASSTSALATFSVTPAGGAYTASTSAYMDIALTDWTTSDKAWIATSTTGAFNTHATSTVYTIGDLAPSSYYSVNVDGSQYAVAQSNGSGQISFIYSGGYSTHTFSISPYSTGGTSYIYGCMDSTATNYDVTATSDDGRCAHVVPKIVTPALVDGESAIIGEVATSTITSTTAFATQVSSTPETTEKQIIALQEKIIILLKQLIVLLT